jgi:hypothetical protein
MPSIRCTCTWTLWVTPQINSPQFYNQALNKLKFYYPIW